MESVGIILIIAIALLVVVILFTPDDSMDGE